MAKKSNFGIQFEGFDELMEKLDELEGDLKAVAEDCLKVARDTVTPKLHADMQKHNRSGDTAASIVDNASVTWEGTIGSTDIGFDLKHGGMPSIFLMHGTPRMKKDTKLYNDIYGAQVKKEIAKKQEEIIQNAIAKRLGG